MTTNSTQGSCEVCIGERGVPGEPQCGQPATWRYPAMGGGYMRLCAEHGAKHAQYSERWDGTQWQRSAASSSDPLISSPTRETREDEKEREDASRPCRLCGHARSRHHRYGGCAVPHCDCAVSSSRSRSFVRASEPRPTPVPLVAMYRDGIAGLGRGHGRPLRYASPDGRFVVIVPKQIGGVWIVRERGRTVATVSHLRDARRIVIALREGQ